MWHRLRESSAGLLRPSGTCKQGVMEDETPPGWTFRGMHQHKFTGAKCFNTPAYYLIHCQGSNVCCRLCVKRKHGKLSDHKLVLNVKRRLRIINCLLLELFLRTVKFRFVVAFIFSFEEKTWKIPIKSLPGFRVHTCFLPHGCLTSTCQKNFWLAAFRGRISNAS